MKANAIDIADLDHDGRADIIAADQTSILYFLGNGDGTFQNGVPIAPNLPGGYAALAVSDVNGDGLIDIAAGSSDPRFGPGVVLLQAPAPGGFALFGFGLALLILRPRGRLRPRPGASRWR